MSTGLSLVTNSLRMVQAIASGEDPTAAMANDALASLNGMLGTWNAEMGPLFVETQDSFTLVSGTAAYTWGTGGTFNSSRPQNIKAMYVRVNGSDLPVEVLTNQVFQEITNKDTDASIPQYAGVLPGYPLNTITFWPKPNAAYALRATSLKPLASLTLLDTLSFPPGYEEALTYNLALRLGIEYPHHITPAMVKIAQDSYSAICRAAVVVEEMDCDPNLPGVRRGRWNWRLG